MKTVAITGASGLLATELIHALLGKTDYSILAISESIAKLNERYANKKRVVSSAMDELLEKDDLPVIDVMVHTAFARSKDGYQIASSLRYTEKAIRLCKMSNAKAFINISSQSVYDHNTDPLWSESADVAPHSLYALGKYASELIVEAAFMDSAIRFTNIRLSSLCENARFLNVFAKNLLANKPVKVIGGHQQVSFLDVRDAAQGLCRIILSPSDVTWAPIYNLGSGKCTTIEELAQDLRRLGKQYLNLNMLIEREPNETRFAVGMNNELFCDSFEWEPQYDHDDMLLSLLELNGAKVKGGGSLYRS